MAATLKTLYRFFLIFMCCKTFAVCPNNQIRIASLSASFQVENTITDPNARKERTVNLLALSLNQAPLDAKLLVLPEAILSPLPANRSTDYTSVAEARQYAYELPRLRERITTEPLRRFAEIATGTGRH